MNGASQNVETAPCNPTFDDVSLKICPKLLC